ncbi:hypothetical protein MANES_07G068316v8 [Manihot esculenta]|uniref:Uncharacterized protein n=1 Tax=Manihot esculenta TaxID=3983 RepID=A0ACB7HEX7_MANES|nr:hypothetical protein MANES_07G068316v8 [Manihot esculenta]
MKDYVISSYGDYQPPITRPAITANNFELKPSFMLMTQQNQFRGTPLKNLHAYLNRFLEISDSTKMNGVTEDVIRLRLFSFSLRDKAKEWLDFIPPGSITTKAVGVLEVDALNFIHAKFDALTKELKNMSVYVAGNNSVDTVRNNSAYCEFYGRGHICSECSSMGEVANVNSSNYPKPTGNPYSNTYNPGWRNYLNFKLLMENFLFVQQKQDEAIRLLTAKVDQLATHNKMLENHIAQQTSSSSKAAGKLPSQHEYPRGHYNAIILRSEFQKGKLDTQFGKFLKVLKSLYINIPFTEALSQIPSYTKFIKEILSKKRMLEESGNSSILCDIGNLHIDKTLYDLSATVSLMPLSICQKLKLDELKPTTISFQLANRSIKYLRGILENISLKISKFFILVDFIVFDLEEDMRTHIILRRPFLATTGATVDVKNGKLALQVGKSKLLSASFIPL